MFKKLLVSVTLAIFLLTSVFVPVVKAQQSTWYNQGFVEWYDKVYNPDTSPGSEIFGERYTAAQVEWVIYGLGAFFINRTGVGEVILCFMRNQSAIGDILGCGPMLVGLFPPIVDAGPPANRAAADQNILTNVFSVRPISGIGYVQDKLQNLSIVKEARAQGFGFTTGASSVVAIWRVSRNIAYTLMVLVVLVIAFMIMFRVKISPQAVIGAQTALPKIVIALILITFSYAIAGFLIDLMYIVMGLLTGLLVTSGVAGQDGLIPMPNGGWIFLFNALTQRSGFELMISYWVAFAMAFWPAISSLAVGSIPGFVLAILAESLWPLVFLVMLLVSLWAGIKILILMIKTYINILLLIIVGPFYILVGAISSSGGGVSSWIRDLMSHLAVYPLVAFMFTLSLLFLAGVFGVGLQAGAELGIDTSWISTLITGLMPLNVSPDFLAGSSWDPPLTVGAGSDAFLWLVVSLGILLLIPSAAEIIKSIISKRPFSYGSAIGQTLTPMPVTVGAAAGAGFVGERLYKRTDWAGTWKEDLTKKAVDAFQKSSLNRFGTGR